MPLRKEYIFGVRNLKVREGHKLLNYNPFNRMLISQAKYEGCSFLTADSNMDNYDENTIYKIN